MATLTINIPTDKEDWVLDGLAIRFGYQTENNPETKAQFAKRMIIHMIKNEANTGHNQTVMEANAVIANETELT